MIGHGDSFVLRDPAGIRPAFYFKDEEIIVVASERPAIQTAFNLNLEDIQEIPPGNALIINKKGELNIEQILKPTMRKSCSFERIYFSRGSDADIYRERKELGKLIMPKVFKEINYDINNSVFSYIPNTAETSFYGMVESIDNYLIKKKTKSLLDDEALSKDKIKEVLSERARIEKIAIKDVKLRTFITEDSSRDDLVEHVYDITYGVIKESDTLIIIDDSIVRGTTLKKSILKMLDRLKPKKIVVVSSAPQIRYPDCYGIDMANLDSLVAFRALLKLLEDTSQYDLIEKTYKKCKEQEKFEDKNIRNHVKDLYDLFDAEQISDKITELLSTGVVNAKVKIIFQSIENLHKACPENLGDWYFTGNYPTYGGNRVVNNAFINFYEGNNKRAY
jgi:amidophosphoribosyltransferase